MNETKEEILKGLIISEEDTRAQLQRLVAKAKKLFGIEKNKKKIVFSQSYKFTNREKILLYLTGKYFAKQLNLIEESKFKSKDISDDLGVKTSTLSKPLGEVFSEGLVEKEGQVYSIVHYRIGEIIDIITQKYECEDIQAEKEPGKKARKRAASKKREVQTEIVEVSLTANPKGIDDLAKDIEVEQDRLNELFEFEDEEIHILEELKGKTESKTQFNTALAYLTTYYYYFHQQEIKAATLFRIMEDLGIGAISHLSRNLSKDRKLLIPKKKKKRVDIFRITKPGIKLGALLIKEYLSK